MAYTMREIAQYLREDAQDGISWIVLWKEGRGWGCNTVYLDEKRDGTVELDNPEDMESLQRVLTADPNAIIVNSYVHNLGVCENYVSRDNLAAALRWQYDLQNANLADFMERVVENKQSPAAHGEQIADTEMANCTNAEENKEDGALEAWGRQERTITLTKDQWTKLTTYLIMTTNYREGERDAWASLAEEKSPDGSPKFEHAASNAEYWQEMIDTIETIRKTIDAA